MHSKLNEGWAAAGAFLLLTAALALPNTGCKRDPGATAPSDQSKAFSFGGGNSFFPPAQVTAPEWDYLGRADSPNLRHPLRIAVRADDGFLVTDAKAGGIHLLNPLGEYEGFIDTVTHPYAVAENHRGNILVGDARFGRVLEIDYNGQILRAFGQGPTEFGTPNDLAIDPVDQHVLVVDSTRHRVARYDADGTFLSAFGSEGDGPGEFKFPVGIAISADGSEIYVTESHTARVQVFDEGGVHLRFLSSFGSDAGELVRPEGLALDGEERVYVTDVFQGHVSVLGAESGFAGTVSSMGIGPGQLGLPSDAVIDSYNRLVVTSYRTQRVEFFGLDDYEVPIIPLDADATVVPAILNLRSQPPWVHLYVDVPGSTNMIDLDTLVVAGILTVDPSSVDFDVRIRSTTYELRTRFDPQTLLDLYSEPGDHQVPFTGMLVDGQSFEGSFTLRVRGNTNRRGGQR
jgi:DNA-binding beta-propeller fold protein YncE